jgi:hypothetical protein
MIGMEVGEKDVVEIEQAHRAQQLALGAFAAVEEQSIATAPNE